MYIIYCVYNKIVLFVFLYFWEFLWYLENLPLVNTECFSDFVSLMTYLGYIFLLDVSIFTTIDDEKCKNQFFKYFEGFYLNLRRKFWKFINTQKIQLHTNSEDISEIKLTSLLRSTQNSHLITWTLLVLKIFNMILIIALSLSDFELWIVKCSSSHFFISYA